MLSQGYLFDATICTAILWLFYVLLLHRRINLRIARIYLLSVFPAGMLLPLIKIPLLPGREITLAPLPFYMFEGEVTEEIVTASSLGVMDVLKVIWLAGAVIMAAILIVGIVKVAIRIRRSTAASIQGARVVFDPRTAGAYSVFGTIFVNHKYEGSPLLGQILSHEQSHLSKRHSLDLVWIHLWRSLFWWNPVAWHLPKLLREVHEFQADQHVIREGNPVGDYINLLIDAEVGTYPGAANPLCYSLTKKRIKMMKNYVCKPKRWGILRLLALVPVTGVLLCAFSLTAKADVLVEWQADGVPEEPQVFHGTYTSAETEKDEISENQHFAVHFSTNEDGSISAQVMSSSPEEPEPSATYELEASLAKLIQEKQAETEEFQKIANKKAEELAELLNSYSSRMSKEMLDSLANLSKMAKEVLQNYQGKWNADYQAELSGDFEKRMKELEKLQQLYMDTIQNYQSKISKEMDELINESMSKKMALMNKKMAVFEEKMDLVNSLGEGNGLQPIVILDGKRVDPQHFSQTFDYSDCESIMVLKGNAAISSYGEEGKNGAIVIETKKRPQKKGKEYRVVNPDGSLGRVLPKDSINLYVGNFAQCDKNGNILANFIRTDQSEIIKTRQTPKVSTKSGLVIESPYYSIENSIIRLKPTPKSQSPLLIVNGKETRFEKLDSMDMTNLTHISSSGNEKANVEKYGKKGKYGVIIVNTK